jgi:alkaline phosphatase
MHARVRFRTAALLLVVGILLAPSAVLAGARNVILLIGDGLGPSQFGAAWLYSNRVLGKELRMVEVMQAGRTGYLVNDTADAMVTESAAAAGQIATGVKMTARALSMAADGKTSVKTILELAAERGMATGLVTTSGITDATPGAFAAHVPHRSDEASVADQELKAGVDVLMGGRKQFFLPKPAGGARKDDRNLLEEARAAGYTVVGTAAELDRAEGPKVLGLFNMGNMAYEIDRATTEEPSLAAMTAKTLALLAPKPKGFFAMIEGGRIDHASHRNDAAATIQDVLAFDAAVGVALDFQRRNPDTLLIVAADHETGGMALIGHSKTSKEYTGMDLEVLKKARGSMELLAARLGKDPSPERIRLEVQQTLGVEITEDEARTVSADTIRTLDPKNYSYPTLHSLAFVLRPYQRVGWGSQTHTASPLLVYGVGPGSETLSGFRHNTDLFRTMKWALGLN